MLSAILSVAMFAPAPQPVHLGAGWRVGQATETLQVAPDPDARASGSIAPPPRVFPQASIRPASTLDAVRHTRRARALAVGGALAVQGAMIVYGILSLLDQQREVRERRAAEGPLFSPYPR